MTSELTSTLMNALKATGQNIHAVKVVLTNEPIALALGESSVSPKGGFKQAWTMRLLRSGSKCQLPRGFVKGRNSVFVG